MKRAILLSSILLTSASFTLADPPQEPSPSITLTSPTSLQLAWNGTNGNTYFIQHSTDLISWKYMPVIESGTGEPLGYGFSTTGDKLFFRLQYTDASTNSPLTDDFDGDGISNWDEIRIGGTATDPFKTSTAANGQSDYYADSNENGMPDGWEVANGNLGRA